MKYYTNYFSSDATDELREIEVLSYDHNKYCHVRFIIFGEYHYEDIKTGYIFTLDKNMKRKPIKKNYLIKLPISKDDSAPTRKEIAKIKREIIKDKKFYNVNYFYLISYDVNGEFIRYIDCKNRSLMLRTLIKNINDKNIFYTVIEKGPKVIADYSRKTKSIITRCRFNLKKICKSNGLFHIRPTLQPQEIATRAWIRHG